MIECIEGKQKEKKEINEKEYNEKNEEKINNKKDDIIKIILNEFLNKLFDEKYKNLFSKDEFFTDINNVKVSLLCTLQEKEKIENNTNLLYFDNINNRLKEIRRDLDGNIRKETLEKFLKIDKSLTEKKIDFKHSLNSFSHGPNALNGPMIRILSTFLGEVAGRFFKYVYAP